MKKFILAFTFLFGTFWVSGQNAHPHPHSPIRAIEFPDIPGYRTLKCDFHQHTVFSDGNVWPTIRVEEALRDSLDAISLTEHIEYQPHRDDIPHPDRNRAFELAKDFATAFDLLVVNGSEITRRMPPGHCNAIFLQDANKLIMDDSIEVFREAKRQGAFVFWNHPNWTAQSPDGIARLTDLHRQLIDEGLIQGIEVVNNVTYSEEALRIALENDLTIMGTSDIHGLVDWQYDVPQGGHRPITLVFAEERSEAAIKEALLARRTVAWFNNTLIGRAEFLVPLVQNSLQVVEAAYQNDTQVLKVKIENRSDADFHVQNLSPYSLHANAGFITLPAQAVTELQVKTLQAKESIEMKFRVLNGILAPGEHPEVTLPVEVATSLGTG
jgi:hypothetical protein